MNQCARFYYYRNGHSTSLIFRMELRSMCLFTDFLRHSSLPSVLKGVHFNMDFLCHSSLPSVLEGVHFNITVNL